MTLEAAQTVLLAVILAVLIHASIDWSSLKYRGWQLRRKWKQRRRFRRGNWL